MGPRNPLYVSRRGDKDCSQTLAKFPKRVKVEIISSPFDFKKQSYVTNSKLVKMISFLKDCYRDLICKSTTVSEVHTLQFMLCKNMCLSKYVETHAPSVNKCVHILIGIITFVLQPIFSTMKTLIACGFGSCLCDLHFIYIYFSNLNPDNVNPLRP